MARIDKLWTDRRYVMTYMSSNVCCEHNASGIIVLVGVTNVMNTP